MLFQNQLLCKTDWDEYTSEETQVNTYILHIMIEGTLSAYTILSS